MLIKSQNCVNFLQATVFAQYTIDVTVISRTDLLKSKCRVSLSVKDNRVGERKKLFQTMNKKACGIRDKTVARLLINFPVY